jgi:WD40 repeat protein
MMKSRTSFTYSVLLLVFTFASAVCLAQKPELVVQTGHARGVSCIAFHPDGRVVATGGSGGTIKLWDVAAGKELRAFVRDDDSLIETIVFHPDGRTLASGDENGTIKVWIADTGKKLSELGGHYSQMVTSLQS